MERLLAALRVRPRGRQTRMLLEGEPNLIILAFVEQAQRERSTGLGFYRFSHRVWYDKIREILPNQRLRQDIVGDADSIRKLVKEIDSVGIVESPDELTSEFNYRRFSNESLTRDEFNPIVLETIAVGGRIEQKKYKRILVTAIAYLLMCDEAENAPAEKKVSGKNARSRSALRERLRRSDATIEDWFQGVIDLHNIQSSNHATKLLRSEFIRYLDLAVECLHAQKRLLESVAISSGAQKRRLSSKYLKMALDECSANMHQRVENTKRARIEHRHRDRKRKLSES